MALASCRLSSRWRTTEAAEPPLIHTAGQEAKATRWVSFFPITGVLRVPTAAELCACLMCIFLSNVGMRESLQHRNWLRVL